MNESKRWLCGERRCCNRKEFIDDERCPWCQEKRDREEGDA